MVVQNDFFIKLICGQPLIGNRFSCLELISMKGNFSVLFRALDESVGNIVAIKFFNPNKKDDEYRLKCFHREAQLLQDLKNNKRVIDLIGGLSNHSIKLTDTNTGIEVEDDFEFIVLELADSDIEAYIYEGQADALQKLIVFKELCKGIFSIHRKGICHRDLKPDNFLILDNGNIKVSDFGTAITLTGSIPLSHNYTLPVGDFRYAAPELFCGVGIRDSSAFASDIFSLGCILFEMFTKTVLTGKVYSKSLAAALIDLCKHLSVVSESNRKTVFDGTIDTVMTPHRLPDIFSYNDEVPKCIKSDLNKLYKEMVQLNYQKRNINPQSIIRQLDICIIVLKNQQKEQFMRRYKRLLREKKLC